MLDRLFICRSRHWLTISTALRVIFGPLVLFSMKCSQVGHHGEQRHKQISKNKLNRIPYTRSCRRTSAIKALISLKELSNPTQSWGCLHNNYKNSIQRASQHSKYKYKEPSRTTIYIWHKKDKFRISERGHSVTRNMIKYRIIKLNMPIILST